MQDIKEALDKFFEDKNKGKDKNNVALLKGGWGVGKTYFWDNYIANKMKNEKLEQIAYSYISLFGKTSLSDVRKSVFHSAKPIGSKDKIKEILKDRITNPSKLADLTPWMSWFTENVQNVPVVGQFSNMISNTEYSLVNNYVICFDDLERKADALTVKEIMGFIDELAILKDCKVILIFNENALHSDIDKIEFDLYREKIFDIELNYDPTCADNVRIVFQNYEHLSIIQDTIKELNIKNIRILKKIHATIKAVYNAYKSIHNEFPTSDIKEFITHAAFLSWRYYIRSESSIMPFKDITHHLSNNSLRLLKDSGVEDDAKRCGDIAIRLKLIPFLLDPEIISYLEQGFVKKRAIPKLIGECL